MSSCPRTCLSAPLLPFVTPKSAVSRWIATGESRPNPDIESFGIAYIKAPFALANVCRVSCRFNQDYGSLKKTRRKPVIFIVSRSPETISY